MIEACGRAQEAWGGEQDELSRCRAGSLSVESSLDDFLNSADVDEIEVKGTAAGGIEPLAARLIREPQQPLRLA